MEHESNVTICFVAGQSGGHIIPCLTLAKHEYSDARIIFFSTTGSLDYTLLAHNKQIARHIPLACASRSYTRSSLHAPLCALRLFWALMRSIYYLIKEKPKKVISTGSIVALPVCIAAWLLRIPVELFELNAVPGRAIKMLAPFASTLYVCFPSARAFFAAHKTRIASYPMRIKEQPKKESASIPTLLILGGSQGSAWLNMTIQHWLATRKNNAIRIIHQTGASTHAQCSAFYKKHGVEATVFAFNDSMQQFYDQADLIICRAGAGTLFESAASGAPCIVIPLTTLYTSHQKENAYAMRALHEERITVFEQEMVEQNPEHLYAALEKLLQCTSASQNITTFSVSTK